MKFPLPPNSKDGPLDARVSDCSNSSNTAVRKISGLVYLPALTLFLFFVCFTAAGQEHTRRVLILTGSDPNHPGFSIITRTIRSTLRDTSSSRIELLYELQEGLVKPPESPTGDEELSGYLRRKYDSQKLDLVLVLAASRFSTLVQEDPALFKDVPKIFYDFDTEREATNRILGPNISGVWANLDLHLTLDLALALHPGTRKVVVTSGSNLTDQIVRERAVSEFRPYENKVEFVYLTGGTIEELKSALSALDKQTVVMFLTFTSDRAGNRYTGPEVLTKIAASSTAPIYGNADTLMGLGVVGGNLLDSEATGQRLGEMSLRVLAGERPEQIPQEAAPRVTTVDWRELQRWGISEDRLPPGTVVKFKQLSFWELYKWYAIGLVAAVSIEALLIAWLSFIRLRRRQAEEENLRLARLAQAGHKRLDEVVSNVPGVVWENCFQPGEDISSTTFISDYVEKMLGYTAEEWLAKPNGFGLSIMPEEDRKRVLGDAEAVMASGKEGVSQFRWLAKDGRTVWVESHLSPIVDEHGKVLGLRGVSLDITERKLSEEVVRQTEEKDRAILNAVPDLMFLQTRDGVYLDYHATDSNELFVPPHEFLGKNMRDILPSDLVEKLLRCFEHAEKFGEPQILEYKLAINETDRWYEARIVRSGDNILSVIRNITQRVFIEEAIKRNEAELAGIIGSAMDAIITVDEKQQIMLFNAAAEKIFGCAAAGALRQSFERFISERSREAFRGYIREFGQQNGSRQLPGTRGDLYGLRGSGEEFPIEASISQIEVSGQKCYTIILRDITERKQAETALRESELNYRSIFNAANDAIFLYELETGAILDVNERMCEMYGYTVEEARQLSALALSSNEPPFTGKEAMALIQKAENDESQLFEWLAKKKSGDLFWVEVGLRHILLRGRSCLLAIVRDITERKNAMDELRRSDERFGKAFRANPQPMFLSTVASGLYVDVNDSFLDMSGYTREQVVGHGSFELGMWERADSRIDFVQRLQEGGSVSNVETKFRTRDGSIKLLLSSADLLDIGGDQCLLVASTDITERNRAQEALRESEERFRNMAETTPVMIWVADAQQQTTYLNKQFLKLTGRSLEQELGFGWSQDVHPDDLEATVETYTNAFKHQISFELECRLRRADGEYRWILVSGAPRFSPTEEFLGYIGSCIDITERKESEQEIRQAHEQLVVAHEEVSSLKNRLEEENIYLREEIKLEQNFDDIVGASDALKYVLFKIEQVAPTDSTVLITGETGTGKELVARAIHNASSRKDHPLVKVNCAALSASLIESELFGHEKGAFTGAMARKIGRFELANKATIFLDEIGDLPQELQVKLLRVIQEGEFERLGSSSTIKVDVRIIAATNRNLDVDVKQGRFREDLWYRLNVFPITVPPLRHRREDVPLLVEHFVRKFSNKLGKVMTSVSPATMNSLRTYAWPGNVRELANVIERATITAPGSVLRIADDFGKIGADQIAEASKTLEELERDYIVRILVDTGWRIEGPFGAARILGMNPSTLRTRISKLGIQKPGQSFTTAAS